LQFKVHLESGKLEPNHKVFRIRRKIIGD